MVAVDALLDLPQLRPTGPFKDEVVCKVARAELTTVGQTIGHSTGAGATGAPPWDRIDRLASVIERVC